MWQVCRITFLEGVRNRVLYSVFVLAVIVMFLSVIFSSFFMRDLAKVTADFNLSGISFAGLLISFSVSVGLIAKDLDRRTIYFVLARGISRRDYIFGKFAGVAVLLGAAYLMLYAVSFIPVFAVKSMSAAYFSSFSLTAYTAAVVADFMKCLLLNAVILFFSSFVTNSFTALIFSIMVYIAGQALPEVAAYIASGADVSGSLAAVINFSKYIVPNFSLLDFKVVAANGIMPPPALLAGSLCYGAVYSLVLLFLGGIIFERRQFL
jgi:ABC-type transport system involved in multi-copper enzyme maturation permease subunit